MVVVEACDFKKKVLELFSSVCMSILYKMKFQLENHMVKDVRKFEDLSVLDVSSYERFNAHSNTVYKESSRGRAPRMQKTLMLMTRKQRGERYKMSTKIESRSQSVVHRRYSKYMEVGGALVQPIWIMSSDEIVRSNSSTGTREQRNENVTTILNNFSKYGVVVLADLVKGRLQGQG